MASTPISIRSLAVACALAGALLLSGIAAGDANAAGVVGSTGQISGCYVKKGKAKGTLRVVAPGHRCRKGEKPLAWNAQGQSGTQGTSGTQGGSASLDALTAQISLLQGRVTQLEGVLSGLTNSDLLGAISGVDALCTQMSTVVTQLNSVRTVLTGLSLGGVLPLGLLLNVPAIPSALGPFSCS
jgi:hypothetical protein